MLSSSDSSSTGEVRIEGKKLFCDILGGSGFKVDKVVQLRVATIASSGIN